MQYMMLQRLSLLRRGKSVRFAANVDICEVHELQTCSDKSKDAKWFYSRDSNQIHQIDHRHRFSSDEKHPANYEADNNELVRRRGRAINVIEAVMEEQINQWEKGEYDLDRLANASIVNSAASQTIARANGIVGEIAVYGKTANKMM